MKRLVCSITLLAIVLSICGAQTFSAQHIKNSAPSIESMSTSVPPPPSKPSRSTSPHYSHHSVAESIADSIADSFFNMLMDLWLLDTIFISFDDYPYANGDKYLIFSADSIDVNFDDYVDAMDRDFHRPKQQFYRFAADTSAFFFPGSAIGNETRFEGLIWKFFGPLFQIDTIFPISARGNMDKNFSVDTCLQLGLQLSIIQTNPISLYWAICWERLQLQNYPVLNGVSFQLIARSYIAKPILVEWRGTIAELFDDGREVFNKINWESHLEIGIMVNGPLEVFAAWRYIGYLGLNYTSNGVELGARYHL